jgi:hypothetical protein
MLAVKKYHAQTPSLAGPAARPHHAEVVCGYAGADPQCLADRSRHWVHVSQHISHLQQGWWVGGSEACGVMSTHKETEPLGSYCLPLLLLLLCLHPETPAPPHITSQHTAGPHMQTGLAI